MNSFLSADEIDETLKYTPSNGSQSARHSKPLFTVLQCPSRSSSLPCGSEHPKRERWCRHTTCRARIGCAPCQRGLVRRNTRRRCRLQELAVAATVCSIGCLAVVALVTGLGVHEKGNDESVKTQDFSENENENHSDEQPRLLGRSTDTGVTHDSDGETSSHTGETDSETSTELDEVGEERRVLLQAVGDEDGHDETVDTNNTSHDDGDNVYVVLDCYAVNDSASSELIY